MPALKYWDGSAWQTLPVGIGVYEQPGDPGVVPNGTIWIDTDEAAAYNVPGIVSVLPSSPSDGQEVYYQSTAMATDGVVWHLRYRAAAAGSYKWEYIGGGPQVNSSNVQQSLTIASASVHQTYTSGPTLTLPLAGDYMIQAWFDYQGDSAPAYRAYGCVSVNSVVQGLWAHYQVPAQFARTTMQAYYPVTGASAGHVLRATASSDVAAKIVLCLGARLLVTPVRVG